MKKLTLFGTGLAGLFLFSTTSLAIQCKLDVKDSDYTPKITCKPAGTAIFSGGVKIPLYDVIMKGKGFTNTVRPRRRPYINFYIPQSLAKDLIVLYDGGFELIPRGYTNLRIIGGMDSFGILYINRAGTGCIGTGGTGGAVESACIKAGWFHDLKDIRNCGNSGNKPPHSKVPLEKNYRTKTVLAKVLNAEDYFFCNSDFIKGLKYHSGFMIQQGSNEADIVLPEKQRNLARILANYYYYMFIHQHQ